MKKNLTSSKLIAYSAAATATLALAPNAIGTIIHNTANLTFGVGQGGNKSLTMEGTTAEFELGGLSSGGVEKFYCNRAGDNASLFGTFMYVGTLLTNQYVGSATNVPNIFNPGIFYSAYYGSSYGNWGADNETHYCGISFDKEGGGKVYGWMQVTRVSPASGKLIDWAYEDDGTRIKVGALPEPATGLALLALGAAGIAAYRRK